LPGNSAIIAISSLRPEALRHYFLIVLPLSGEFVIVITFVA